MAKVGAFVRELKLEELKDFRGIGRDAQRPRAGSDRDVTFG